MNDDIFHMKISFMLLLLSVFLVSACKVSYKKAGLDDSATDEFTDDSGDDGGSDEEVSTIFLNTKVCLQGAFDGEGQSSMLSTFGLIPKTSPYADALEFNGGEFEFQLLSPVDWVYVTLLDASDSEIEVISKSVLLLPNGRLYDPEVGESGVYFSGVEPDEYFLRISHRNHLFIESESSVALELAIDVNEGTELNIDMTEDDDSIYYVDDALKVMGSQRCMKAGDVNQDGLIDATDEEDILTSVDELSSGALSSTLIPGYIRGDVDLSGLTSQDLDKTLAIENVGSSAFITP